MKTHDHSVFRSTKTVPAVAIVDPGAIWQADFLVCSQRSAFFTQPRPRADISANPMTSEKFSPSENRWVANLLDEAKRDLVFVFNIAAGAFGGPTDMSSEDVPGRIERVARALLDGGCTVGFGDPDFSFWRVPDVLAVPRNDVPATVKKLWVQDRETYQFLAFARRLR